MFRLQRSLRGVVGQSPQRGRMTGEALCISIYPRDKISPFLGILRIMASRNASPVLSSGFLRVTKLVMKIIHERILVRIHFDFTFHG